MTEEPTNSEFKIQNSELKKHDIYERAFQFACRIVRLHRSMSRKGADRVAADQVLRSGTGVGSNLEEANGAQSRADFVSKLRIALKEARESHYWLRLIEATEMVSSKRVHSLVVEASEIVAILTTIVKNTTAPKRSSS